MFEADDWCCMEPHEDCRFTYMWTLKNFNTGKYPKIDGEYIDSSTFTTISSKNEERKWCLRLYPFKSRKQYSDYHVSLYLVLISGKQVRVTYTFSCINDEGEKEVLWGANFPEKFAITGKTEDCCRGKNELFERSYDAATYPSKYCKNDCLNILCEMAIITFPHTTEEHKFEDSVYYHAKDLGQVLLDNQGHSDLVLQVKGQELRAHKAVLAARSPVFSAMFANEMEEKNRNRVLIADMSPDTVFQMLRFIYTGKVLDMTKMTPSTTAVATTMAAELLKAADKYELEGLMHLCEKGIAINLNVDTAAEILILADLHNASELKQKAIDFIKGNREEVKKTEGWKRMTQDYPKLVLDAIF